MKSECDQKANQEFDVIMSETIPFGNKSCIRRESNSLAFRVKIESLGAQAYHDVFRWLREKELEYAILFDDIEDGAILLTVSPLRNYA